MVTIHPDRVEIALERVPGSLFEHFIHEFFSALIGVEFVPLGGMHDAGADGLQESAIWVERGDGRYLQASVEEDVRAKITRTVARLREAGRKPGVLTYVSSRLVPRLDLEEEELSRRLDTTIRIRDRRFIANHINHSPQTVAAFAHHLEPLTAFLARPGAANLLAPSPHVKSPAIYIFLRQEVERRQGEGSLVDAVVDSVVLWALEGTDPDKAIFMSQLEILNKICVEIPTARGLLELSLSARLAAMSKRNYPGGRAVNWHRSADAYCLPYESRSRIEQDNASDEVLRIRVDHGLRQRIARELPELNSADLELAATIALRAIQLAYESEGLEFSKFLELRDAGEEFPTFADHIRDAFDETRPNHSERVQITDALVVALRACLYSSSEDERLYFNRLSRTYALLFVLRTQPSLVQYFQEMAGKFYLYVGADQLVRALSERHLPEADRMTRTMLRMAIDAGAELVLTQPVLEEVVGHLRATDIDYLENFLSLDGHVTLEIARNIPKILIRAYFYAKLDPAAHVNVCKTWKVFVGQICDYGDLHKPRALTDVRNYLSSQFRMTYVGTSELEELVKPEELSQLTDVLAALKAGPRQQKLARDDALLVLSVYGRRRQQKETAHASVFGYRTWWVTDEARIIPATKGVINRNDGSRYMMRPDFLLNFIALSPSTSQVRATYERIFPSLLGIRIARRVDQSVFRGLLESVKGWSEWDEGRRTAAVAKLSDTLKADFHKQYASSVSHRRR